MSKEDQLSRADLLITKSDQVLRTHKQNPPNVIGFPTLDPTAFAAWRSQAQSFILSTVGSDHAYARAFSEVGVKPYRTVVETGKGILSALREDLSAGHLVTHQNDSVDVLNTLTRICDRFHSVSRQLRQRHSARPTLDISDEYDVQDFLHALLRLFFDDVRAEEWTPSYAGQSARMDFLLKNERVVVEVKKSRQSMSAGDLGNQLIEDISRYKASPDCDALVCFVYDPEGRIANPRGLESDLTREKDEFPVFVLIRP